MASYSAICAAIQARLETAVLSGNKLDGWTYHAEPVSRVEGLSDLPSVSVQGVELTEEYRSVPEVSGTMRLSVMLATRRKLGTANFLEGVERAMDSLEMTAGGVVDGTLGGLTTLWIEFELSDMIYTDASIAGLLVVRVTQLDVNRGNRT